MAHRNQEMYQEMQRLYREENLTCDEIGKRFGMTRQGVHRYLKTSGIDMRGTGPVQFRSEWEKPLYSRYYGMLSRCHSEGADSYRNYGARGIEVCDEWRESFNTFRDWALTSGYSPELEIDRRNNNKGYSPENCRWVTGKVNCRNTRRTHMLTIDGETKSLMDWTEDSRCLARYECVKRRLAAGWDTKSSVLTPPHKHTKIHPRWFVDRKPSTT